jgi:integrase
LLTRFGTFQSVWSFAKKQGFVERDIVQGVEMPRQLPPKKSFFAPGEIQTLISVASPRWKTPIILGAESGMRRGEIFGLRIRDIDFKSGVIHVRNARALGKDGSPKSGKERTTPVSKAELEMLREHLGTRREGYVFLTPLRTFRNRKTGISRPVGGGPVGLSEASLSFDIILKKAGLKRPGLSWHALRRARATALLQAGCSMAHLRSWLGWSDDLTAEGYINVSEATYAAAMVEKASTLLI